MKSEFSLGQFGQRSPLGVHRFLVLSLLAYLLTHWVRVEREDEGLTWREAGERAARVLLPDFLVWVLFQELHALGLGPPGGGARGEGLCGVCGRCKF